ncbi:hypothetical protein D0T56_02265 [Dysgonomonas sp. 520]|nr:hypothetical protein [Dysgonomonas sp. 520]
MCLFISVSVVRAQVSINSETYKDGTLVVEPNNRTLPNNKTGVIVPRVEKLNTTDPKEDGLLVFLDNPTPPLPTGELNGFYYWDAAQNKWVGWKSMSTAVITDKSQFFASGTQFDTASGTMKDADNPSKIKFNNLVTNNPSICTLSGGAITINKTGWYYLQISVTLTKNADPAPMRDILCLQLLLNGALPTPGPTFRSFSSFAVDNPARQTFTTYAPVKLSVGDVIQLGMQYIYKDTGNGGNPDGSDNTVFRDKMEYSITDGTVATLSAKYLGDF